MRLPITRQQNAPPEYFRMAKPSIQIPDFMDECMNGAPHPLNIEYDDYVRTKIGLGFLDLVHHSHGLHSSEENLTEDEENYIQNYKNRPEVQWAMHNSFDGLYIQKAFDHANAQVLFSFAVYMKTQNRTFWLLKYREQAHL